MEAHRRMTHKDALWHREETYHGVCSAELLKDARMDVLRLLNVYTDLADPSYEQVCVIEKLSKAAHYLEGEEGHSKPEWAHVYPELHHLKQSMDVALDKFLTHKGKGEDAAEHLKEVFKAHKALAANVKSLCATPAEMEVITHG